MNDFSDKRGVITRPKRRIEPCRYGFNGSERDDPGLTEGGTTYDLGIRLYHSGIGRFISIDPEFQFGSGYVGIGNNPVSGIDRNGGFFFGLFGSTTAQRQAARLYKEINGGRTVDWHKETIHNERIDLAESTEQSTPASHELILHDDGVYHQELVLTTAEVVVESTYFDYDSGQPHAKNPMSANGPRGLEFVGTDVYMGGNQIYSDASLTGSADGALRGTWTADDTRYAGYTAKYTGTGLKYLGYLFAGATEGASLGLAALGGRMETVGSAMITGAELLEGNYGSAISEASQSAGGVVMGSSINRIKPSPTERIILEGSSDAVISGSGVAIESIIDK